MSSVVRPTTPDDEPRLIEFLTRVFSAGADEPFVDPLLLRWKYWQPRGDYPEPRSFVIERNEKIAAHIGLWPVIARVGGRRLRGVHMIDWASDPGAPGTGVWLWQHVAEEFDFVYCIGGSEMTQSILPRLGFEIAGETLTCARPIRPLRQIVQHQYRDFRLPSRLARNWWWSKSPGKSGLAGWEAVAAPTDPPGVPACEREASFFNYLRQCPMARSLTFHLLHDGQKAGYLELSVLRDQTRLGGVWLTDPSRENWRAALLLAQQAALQHTGTAEISARCMSEASVTAAEEAGMRVRGRTPVFLRRKAGVEQAIPLGFQYCDSDRVFLDERTAAFLT